MTFYVFNTRSQAEQAEATIVKNVRDWVSLNMSEAISEGGHLRGRNAATGELSDAVTTRWDEPRLLADGRFAILKPTAQAVAPMDLADALSGVTADEMTQAEYEDAKPAPSLPI